MSDKSFKDLLQQIETDPIAGADAAQRRHKSVRKARFQSAVAAFALAASLRRHDKVAEFYKLPFWEDANVRDGSKLLLGTLQHNYGDRIGEESACAQDHYTALAQFEGQVTPEELYALLEKNGGFSGLKARAKRSVVENEGGDQPTRSKHQKGDPKKRSATQPSEGTRHLQSDPKRQKASQTPDKPVKRLDPKEVSGKVEHNGKMYDEHFVMTRMPVGFRKSWPEAVFAKLAKAEDVENQFIYYLGEIVVPID